MDALNNTHVGGPNDLTVSYRFKAAASSKLASIRVYIVGPTHSGYGAGTGGTWQVTVQTDDGTSRHAPSGTVLATTTFKPVDGLPLISWSTPASLSAGKLYHVVFQNIDAEPTSNYASLDGVFMYRPTSPRQARFADVEWGQLIRSGSGSWTGETDTVPIMQANYANGATSGLGYMENWDNAAKTISGSRSAREAFTVSGSNRQVASVAVRLRRVSGSSSLVVRLETAGGSLIEEGAIPASSIPTTGRASWATYTFASSHTLVSGQRYNLVLSSASGTSYSIFVIRKGSAHGFSRQTYFGDGSAQYNPGSGWVAFDPGWRGPLDEADLQFYFR